VRGASKIVFPDIGNSVAPALAKALGDQPSLEVLFSPMRSKARLVDASPSRIIEWRAGTTLHGDPFVLPGNARVISHGASGKRVHYALVCHREQPLLLGDEETVDAGSLVNLLSGNRVGASQVTSVVRQVRTAAARALLYPVALRARLVAPYFVRLTETGPDEQQLAA